MKKNTFEKIYLNIYTKTCVKTKFSYQRIKFKFKNNTFFFYLLKVFILKIVSQKIYKKLIIYNKILLEISALISNLQ